MHITLEWLEPTQARPALSLPASEGSTWMDTEASLLLPVSAKLSANTGLTSPGTWGKALPLPEAQLPPPQNGLMTPAQRMCLAIRCGEGGMLWAQGLGQQGSGRRQLTGEPTFLTQVPKESDANTPSALSIAFIYCLLRVQSPFGEGSSLGTMGSACSLLGCILGLGSGHCSWRVQSFTSICKYP